MKEESISTSAEPDGKPRKKRGCFMRCGLLFLLLVAAFVAFLLVFGRSIRERCVEMLSACTRKHAVYAVDSDMSDAMFATGGAIDGETYDARMSQSSISRAPMRQVAEPETPGTERYMEFRENGFTDASANPLSTFSIDVDTASYTLTRSSLVDLRRLPARDSVRAEEFVNYFDYGYAGPTGSVPYAVSCEMAACPWEPAHKLLRIALQARRVSDAERPPNNLVFLVDVSGSMNMPDRLPLLKQALGMLVDGMRPDDHVAIVVYANGVGVHLEPTDGTRKARIREALNKLVASGGTSGGEGLRLAYETALKNFEKGANNRIILATDGDFNIGTFNDSELVRFIEGQRDKGIFLSVLGFGRGNFMDARMKKLADNGNGSYAFIDSVLEAKKVLGKEAGTLLTVAKDVKIQVDFNPSRVASYRLVGYESRILRAEDFKNDRKDAGEMGAGHSVTVFYELVPAGTASATMPDVDASKYSRVESVDSPELLTVRTRWKAPEEDVSQGFNLPVVASEVEHGEPSESFRFASAVAEAALLLRDSAYKGAADWDAVIDRARKAKGTDEEGYRAEFIRLAETAKILSSQNR